LLIKIFIKSFGVEISKVLTRENETAITALIEQDGTGVKDFCIMRVAADGRPFCFLCQ
jgi:hypothetical protein